MKLDPIIQEIIAEVGQYVAGIKGATESLGGFSKKVGESDSLVNQLSRGVGELHEEAVKFGQAARGVGDAARASFAALDKEFKVVKSDLEGTTRATDAQTAAMKRLMAVSGVGVNDVARRMAANPNLSNMIFGMGQGARPFRGVGDLFAGGRTGTSKTDALAALMGLNLNRPDITGRMGSYQPGIGIGDIFGSRAGGTLAVSDMARRMGLGLNGPDLISGMSAAGKMGGFPLRSGGQFPGPPRETGIERGATPRELASVFGNAGPSGQGTGLPSLSNMLGGTFKSVGDAAANFTNAAVEKVKAGWKSAAAFIKDTFASPDAFFGRMAQGVVGIFKGMWAGIQAGWEGIKAGFAGVKNFFADVFQIDSITKLVLTITGVNLALSAMKTAFDAVTSSISKAIQIGMEMEKVETSFGVLLGSATRGKALFEDIQKMSVVTPFSVSQLASASEILLGMGVAGNQLIPVLSRLGDIAGGDASRLSRLAVVYGEVMAEGKLTGWRIRQLATLGIGVEDLSKTMGVSGGTFRGLMAANLIPGDILTRTLTRLTDDTGRFGSRTGKILDTAFGQWSRLQNVIEVTAGKMGRAFMESSGLAKGLSSVSEYVDSISDKLVALAGWLGGAFGQLSARFGDIVSSIGAGLGGLGNDKEVMGVVRNLIPGTEEIGKFAEDAGDAFMGLIKIVTQGVAVMIQTLGRFVGFLIDAAYMAGKEWFGDKSFGKTKKEWLGFKKGLAPFADFTESAPEIANRMLAGATGEYDARKYIRKEIEAGRGQGIIDMLGGRPEYKDQLAYANRLMGKGGRPSWVPFRTLFQNLTNLPPEAQAVVTDAYKRFGEPRIGIQGTGVTPLEQFRSSMRNIDVAQKGLAGVTAPILSGIVGGLFGRKDLAGAVPGLGKIFGELGAGPAARLKYEDFEKLRKAVGGEISDHLPTTALYGSAEAADTINKSLADNQGVMDQLLSTAQAALDVQQQINENTKQFNEAWEKLPPAVAQAIQNLGQGVN